jgi:hypothetical protein
LFTLLAELAARHRHGTTNGTGFAARTCERISGGQQACEKHAGFGNNCFHKNSFIKKTGSQSACHYNRPRFKTKFNP